MSQKALPRPAHRPDHRSYEERQADVGSSLYLGGIVMLALLALLVWRGLF